MAFCLDVKVSLLVGYFQPWGIKIFMEKYTAFQMAMFYIYELL